MWLLAVGVFAGCKALTWASTRIPNVPAWKQAAYLFAWPGLDAAGFFAPPAKKEFNLAQLKTGITNTAIGAILLFGVARLIPPQHPYLVGWTGMIGIVLILHFGTFQLLSCFWMSAGVQARPLMNRPLASTSLSEFWGRRWNTAFRDFAHRFLFRPLTVSFGPRAGLFAGFLFSGVVHDLVISVPAQGGYGGPTIYFALQGSAMILERSKLGRNISLGSGPQGRSFTMFVLIAPVFLLFHRPFVERVIVPFMRASGALP